MSVVNAASGQASSGLRVGTDVPLVEVSWTGMGVSLQVPATERMETVVSALTSFGAKSETFHALEQSSGVLRAGSATLVLGPPAAGVSTFLRVLSGQQPATSGQVLYNGASLRAVREGGACVEKLAVYGAAEDVHEMHMTPREVFAFAHASAVPPEVRGAASFCRPQQGRGAILNADGLYVPPDAGDMLATMGLSRAADTKCGSVIVRGISGGEKKRVSVGEALLVNARLVALDSPTDGLDAATAHDVVAYVVDWAHATRGVALLALNAPTPETVALFDDVLVLAAGRVLYHGPLAALDAYWASVGYARPSFSPTAEWAIEVAANTHSAAVQSIEDRFGSAAAAAGASVGTAADKASTRRLAAAAAGARGAVPWMFDVAQLARHWADSPQNAVHRAGGTAKGGVALATPLARAQYGRDYALPLLQQLWLATSRQLMLQGRNRLYIVLRIVLTAGMGLMLGSVYPLIYRTQSNYYLFFSLGLYAMCFIAFINNAEIPFAMFGRATAYKLTRMHCISPWVYSTAVVLGHIPLTAVSDILYVTPLYWIAAYAYSGDRWITFLLVLFLQDLSSSAYYRCFTYASRTTEGAMTISSMVIAMGVVSCGFLVIKDQIGWWLRWFLWGSPFFWALTAVANNEMADGRYTVAGPVPGQSVGRFFMDSFSLPFGDAYLWGGVGVLAAYYLIFAGIVQPLVFTYMRFDFAPGTWRVKPSDLTDDEAKLVQLGASARHLVVDPDAPASPADLAAIRSLLAVAAQMHKHTVRHAEHTAVSLPATPVTLAFNAIEYVVPVKGGSRQLLSGVTGFARPGTLTALMGASGAGKSTLLDVLAFRKNTGKVAGVRKLNGVVATHRMFARLAGYCEQDDNHFAQSTVQEALEFAAFMRLPQDVTAAQRGAFVKDMLRVLELAPVAHRSVKGLGRGELKRLTVGVELAGNPPLLFLDEPTTGLDSRSAAVVMRVIRRVASTGTGRTILCTVHQPSTAVFFSFDNLLLLAPGGHQVFAGPLGHHAENVVAYLEAIPGVAPLPQGINPANWMLDCMGASASGGVAGDAEAGGKKAVDASPRPATTIASEGASSAVSSTSSSSLSSSEAPRVASQDVFVRAFAQSAEARRNAAMAAKLMEGDEPTPGVLLDGFDTPAPDEAVAATTPFAPLGSTKPPRGALAELGALTRRQASGAWRTPSYSLARIFALTFIGLFFGLLYLKVDKTTFAGNQSLYGAIIAGMGFVGLISFTIAVPYYMAQRAAFYREKASLLYRTWAYPAAIVLVEIPWVAVVTLVFTAIFYPMATFDSAPLKFFFFYYGVFLGALCFVLGAVSATALFPNAIIAQVAGGVFLATAWLFGGVFVTRQAMPDWWWWFLYGDFMFHIVRALTLTQFHCENEPCQTMAYAGAQIPIDQWSQGLVYATYGKRGEAMGIATAIAFGFIGAAIVLYSKVSWLRR